MSITLGTPGAERARVEAGGLSARVWVACLGMGMGLAAVCMLGSGCVAADVADEDGAPRQVSAVAAAVVGGEGIDACQWPSTVSVNAWGSCTGTLIHSRVVTTAAHCIEDGRSRIYFGASKSTPGAFSVEARCEVGAEGSRGANTSRDWAYCVLPEDERVAQIPVTPPLVGCEAEAFLQPGQLAWVVGFGTTSADGGGAGVKREVAVMVNALDKSSPGTIDVGDADKGACHGDSGGPLYVRLIDGEHDWGYRVVGSTSGAGAKACDCTCSTVYVNIENHVREIEEREGIDVTPCTDADGNFEPSPACDNLLTGPSGSLSTFPVCEVARTLEPIDSCGVRALQALDSSDSGGSSQEGAVDGGGTAEPGAADSVDPSMQADFGAAGAAAPGASADVAASNSGATSNASLGARSPERDRGADGAAGRRGVVSAAFSSTAAGGPAEAAPLAAEPSAGCQLSHASAGRSSAGASWLGASWLGASWLFAAWASRRTRRRVAARSQSAHSSRST